MLCLGQEESELWEEVVWLKGFRGDLAARGELNSKLVELSLS